MNRWNLKEQKEQKDKLEELLDLVVRHHPCGLRVLAGQVPGPDLEDIVRMLKARKKSGNESEQALEEHAKAMAETLESCGGWETVVFAVKAYREACPSSWKIFVDHVTWVEVGGTSRLAGEPQLERIAAKHQVSSDTVQRRRREVLSSIVRMVLGVPAETRRRVKA